MISTHFILFCCACACRKQERKIEKVDETDQTRMYEILDQANRSSDMVREAEYTKPTTFVPESVYYEDIVNQ